MINRLPALGVTRATAPASPRFSAKADTQKPCYGEKLIKIPLGN